jgi:WD40 repeat protein
VDESHPSDDPISALLAAYDDAWIAGGTPPRDDEASVAPELRPDLEQDLAFAQWLHQALPPPTAAADSRPEFFDGLSPLPWARLGRFQLRRELGRGAFGIVYLAYDPALGRDVALKVPRVDVLTDPALRARFHREARAAAGLDHPNIVAVHEAGEVGPVCFLVSAYCRGPTLAQWLKQRNQPMPVREAAALIATLAEAVHHAHTRGVIHRDLKPANILLQKSETPNPKSEKETAPALSDLGFRFSDLELRNSDLTPKVTDFGLAKLLLEQGEGAQTRSEAIVGTAGYMAPEQAGGRSKAVGSAADVYALGAILYELLTGRPPFQAETSLETLLMVRSVEPIPPTRLRLKLPRDLETICLKCLEKEPSRRYASALALAEDLGRFLAGEPIRARPLSWWARGGKWVKRRPAITALLAAVVLIAGGGLTGIVWQWQRAEGTGQELVRNLYYQNIALAEREWSANNFTRADQLLDECPPALRGWEWHYVRGLRYGSLPPLPGHHVPVRGMAFSPDGRRLASAGNDRMVKVWDVATGKALLTLEGSGEEYGVAVTFSPDGRFLAAVAEEGRTIKLWEAQTGTASMTWQWSQVRRIKCLAFSPDSRRLVASAEAPGGGQITIWDSRTGQQIRLLKGHAATATRVAFHPDGQRFASGLDNTVIIWDATTGQVIHTLRGHAFKVASVAFSPDGRQLASAGGPLFRGDKGEIIIWDADNGQVLRTLRSHTGHIFSVAFSPDGRRLASAGYDQTIKIWDAATGQEALSLRGHTDQVLRVAFSPDGRRLASASADKTVRIWDATPLDERPDPALRTLRGHVGFVTWVAFSPDGQRFATTGQDQAVRVWDAATFQELLTLRGHSNHVNGVAFSPDSRRLVSVSLDKTAIVWDAVTGNELLTFRGHTAAVQGVAFSPNGEHVASGDWQHTVKVWDASTGTMVHTLTGHTEGITSVAFSGDGRYLVSSSHDRTIKVWDPKTGNNLRTLSDHAGRVFRVAFSPDSRLLASGGTDGTVHVWQVGTWKALHTLRDQTGWVWCVAFSPDSRLLATAGNDATVKLWDVQTGELLRTLHGHTRWVESVAFSPDGQRLASASWDGTVKIWEVN